MLRLGLLAYGTVIYLVNSSETMPSIMQIRVWRCRNINVFGFLLLTLFWLGLGWQVGVGICELT